MSSSVSLSRRSFLNMVLASSVLSFARIPGEDEVASLDAALTNEPLEFTVSDRTLSISNYFVPPDRFEAYQLSEADINNKEGILELIEYNQSLREEIYWFSQGEEFELELDDSDVDEITRFIDSLSPENLNLLTARVVKWFKSSPDTELEHDENNHEIMVPLGGQSAAFRLFENGGEIEDLAANEIADALGIIVIEGEMPGSTYYAAELTISVDDANKRAEEAGFPIRFVA